MVPMCSLPSKLRAADDDVVVAGGSFDSHGARPRFRNREKRCSEKRKFINGFRAVQASNPSHPKFSLYENRKVCIHARVPPRYEGRFADVTIRGVRDVVDVAMSLDVRRHADGQVVWSWHPWAGAKSAKSQRRPYRADALCFRR
jgi:hypothetical protein